MILNDLEFRSSGLSDAQLRAGLDAALAVLTKAGVTPFEGAYAQDLVRFYDEMTFSASPAEEIDEPKDPGEGALAVPTAAQRAACDAFDRAYDAALDATGHAKPWMLAEIEFRAMPVEVPVAA